MSVIPSCLFGTSINAEHVVATMSQFSSWEDRYRQVILWGKQLPAMPSELKSDQLLVSGCESQVWLVAEHDGSQWTLCGDSDARIVKGLIAIVFAALNNKSSQQIASFDLEAYFSQLGLLSHLSPSRGNGLRAIVEQIKRLAV